MRIYLHSALLFFLFIPYSQISSQQAASARLHSNSSNKNYSAYLFVYFTGNTKNEEAIRFALSTDGYHYRALNRNSPVLSSQAISSTGGVRDPHILRGADGRTFYMVATDMVSANGWNANRAMVLLKSTDLVNWTSSVVNIQKRFPGNDSLLRVWAPQSIYDPQAKKYMIYFSMKHGKDPDKIYYAYANKTFTDLEGEPKQLFFSPDGAACIDGDIAEKAGRYYLFFKTEDRQPGIKVAVSENLTGGYTMLSDSYVQQTKSPVEGAGTFKLIDGSGYILMYDMYTSGRYQFTKTNDFKTFKVVDEEVSMNFHPRHGTVIPITKTETERLVKNWLAYDDVITNIQSVQIKKVNTVFDTASKKIVLSVIPGTNLQTFKPAFVAFPGVSISHGPERFSEGPVQYKVTIKGKGSENFLVAAKETHNPVLNGLYADPDIMYSEKTGKYYIYPTTDGFTNWLGTYFKTFSSTDLVQWKDEGVILNLETDVTWAKDRAWAPSIIERKIEGRYKYFYYYCAQQKIGVAVSSHPAGPFTDHGKPLLDKRPEIISRNGQTVDPDVFHDPLSDKYYLYWGNGYMAGAELNDNMVSIKMETLRELTPPDYTEGTHVFFRNGRYYFLWSENDTRDPNYRVRYGIADAPLGKIIMPGNNFVVVKDTASGIYGTVHNSTIQVPGRDEWYLVYHRFNYPNGINMGRAAGYNREVCIDKMEFNADGKIRQVQPTHEGIKPVK